MAINSRAKGARSERELAKILRDNGFVNARRGCQYNGLNGDADIVDALPGIHIECKNNQRLNIFDAMEQSARDSKGMEIPVVMHKKDRKPWLCTLRLEEFLMIYKMAGIDDGETKQEDIPDV